MMAGQNPHPGDIRHGQIPVGCPTPPLPPPPSSPVPLGLDIDRCISVHVVALYGISRPYYLVLTEHLVYVTISSFV